MKRWALVAVSAGQLACGAWGQYVAIRDEHPYDVPLKGRGSPDRIVQDSWLQGTALSAPVFMLAGQAVATLRLTAGPSMWASRTLGILGACMVGGYLGEREVRSALTPGGLEPSVTPVAAAGLGLAVPMAVLGLTVRPDPGKHRARMRVAGRGRRLSGSPTGREQPMPWTAKDAQSHTKKANTPKKKRQWAKVANAAFDEYGGDEGRAIRVANAAVKKSSKRKKKSGERSGKKSGERSVKKSGEKSGKKSGKKGGKRRGSKRWWRRRSS